MWRRTYLLLLLIRIYFALSPSYLHPDENFQGPEVFAGRIFSYPSKLTWEFTSSHPIRSIFPIWPVYVVPMKLLKWFYNETGVGNPPPTLVYYALRGAMFLLSFVLEDWAIHELVSSPRHRRTTVVLVASSYVTWTYQTHTFTNSLETLFVAWGLVLIRRIVENKKHSSFFSSIVLSFIAVAGIFNRITFPAFLLIPGLQLLPHFWRKPISFFSFVGFGLFFSLIAILIDTTFFTAPKSILDALRSPIVTPINNLVYNSNSSNLALHGLHSRYQHFLINLPELLGPAYVMIVLSLLRSPFSIPPWLRNMRFVSAISATLMLSIFPHQETRFLIPAVPLLLSCIRLPKSRFALAFWVIFNAIMGSLMGIYHQGGVVPTQLAMPSIVSENAMRTSADSSLNDSPSRVTARVFWWKTYSPPIWLLGDSHNSNGLSLEIDTINLMGVPGPEMLAELDNAVAPCSFSYSQNYSSSDSAEESIFLVAPKSATFLDQFAASSSRSSSSSSSDPSSDDDDYSDFPDLELHELWSYTKHVNLDDLSFEIDGIIPTLKRVIGRRGLGVWVVRRVGVGCN